MGKIYGVHDSYCRLISPAGDGGGPAGVCTCGSGKASERVFDRLKKEADWQIAAEKYADDFIEKIINWCTSSAQTRPSTEQLNHMREHLIMTWKAAHPSPTAGVATPPPDALSVAAEDTGFAPPGGDSGDGVALNATSHPIPPKSDAGKARPFTFFMQQFPLTLIEVARHMERGCADPGHVFLGWQEVENGFERYTDAMNRHQLEEVIATVTDIDREEGVDKYWVQEQHAIAVAANALIRLELLLRKRRNLNLDARAAT